MTNSTNRIHTNWRLARDLCFVPWTAIQFLRLLCTLFEGWMPNSSLAFDPIDRDLDLGCRNSSGEGGSEMIDRWCVLEGNADLQSLTEGSNADSFSDFPPGDSTMDLRSKNRTTIA